MNPFCSGPDLAAAPRHGRGAGSVGPEAQPEGRRGALPGAAAAGPDRRQELPGSGAPRCSKRAR